MFLSYALKEAVETMSDMWARPFSRPVMTVVMAVAGVAITITWLGSF
jgi:hypothetical protein